MNRHFLFLASLSALCAGGCTLETFRPVATARSLAAEAFDCSDVAVVPLESDTWGRDPLMGDGDGVYLVDGCGKQATYACSSEGVVSGQCALLPVGPYRSPEPNAAHAAIITEVRSPMAAPAGLREIVMIEDEGWIMRRASPSSVAFPIRTGAVTLAFGAQPMRTQTVHHSVPRSHTSYSYSTDSQGNRVEERTTRHWTEHYTTTHLVSDDGCSRPVHLNARPGMTYRLTLDVVSSSICQVSCTQEAVVGGRLIQTSCEDFSG